MLLNFIKKKKKKTSGYKTEKKKIKKKKKMKKWAGTLGSFMQDLYSSFFLSFFLFLITGQILYRPEFTSRLKLAEIVRNDRNGPKRPEIWPEVERGVFWYQFAYSYEKFLPFWLEWNDINNNGRFYLSS